MEKFNMRKTYQPNEYIPIRFQDTGKASALVCSRINVETKDQRSQAQGNTRTSLKRDGYRCFDLLGRLSYRWIGSLFLVFYCLLASAGSVFRVGTEATYAPFEWVDDQNQIVGFDIDVMKAIAAREGFTVKFINTPWEGMLEMLKTGDLDIVAAAITITPARQKTLDFSDSYFESRQLIVVQKQSGIKQFTDLKTKKVGVQTGTTGDEAMQQLQGRSSLNIRRFDSIILALQELLNGGIDAVVADQGVASRFLANNKNNSFKIIDDYKSPKNYFGIVVRKGNKDLMNRINKGLATIKADGTYNKIYQKYFDGAK